MTIISINHCDLQLQRQYTVLNLILGKRSDAHFTAGAKATW